MHAINLIAITVQDREYIISGNGADDEVNGIGD